MNNVVDVERTETLALTPEHPQWDAFIEYMMDPYSCDRLNNFDGHTCPNDHSLGFTRRVLELFPDIDTAKTLEFFEQYEGTCDCKVINKIVYTMCKDPEPLTEEEEYEADLCFAIEFLFWYWTEQGLDGDQIKQKVVGMATDFSDHFCQINQGGAK